MINVRSVMSRRKELVVVAVCMALFLTLTSVSIGKFSSWHDEGYTKTLIESSYSGIVERTALDVHPPFYYLVLKAWGSVVGDSVVALRYFSVICMLGAILITWWIVRRIYGQKAALLCLLAMAAGPFVVRFGQEMRMYGLASLLASIATYIYITYYKRAKMPLGIGLLYGLIMVLGIYTQYFFVLVLAAHMFHALFMAQEGSFLRRIKAVIIRYGVSFTVVALLFAPWIPKVASQFSDVQGSFWIGPVGVETLTSTPIAMLTLKKQGELIGRGAPIALLALGFVIIALRQFMIKKTGKDSRLLLSAVIVPPVTLFALSLPPFQPSYQDRYMSFMSTVFYSLVALGVLFFASRRKRIIGGVVLVALLGYGQVVNFIYGNSYGWGRANNFSMKDIRQFVTDDSPVYSTSLWTFFDAKATFTDRAVLLLQKDPITNWHGNASAIYNRPDLVVYTIPADIKSFWLIDESGDSKYSGEALASYTAEQSFVQGYAKVTEYVKN